MPKSIQNHCLLLTLVPLLLLAGCDDAATGGAVHHQYPAMDTVGFDRFAKECSYCHAPPQPSKHRAKDWPMVMARMMQHRAERGLAPLSSKEQVEILKYLQHYAAESV